MGPRYPVMVDLVGRPCLVVGGGGVATRKVLGLLAAEAGGHRGVAHARRAACRAGRCRSHLVAARPSTTRSGAPVGSSRWAFVVAATDDGAVNAQVMRDAADAGVLGERRF